MENCGRELSGYNINWLVDQVVVDTNLKGSFLFYQRGMGELVAPYIIAGTDTGA